MYMLISMMERPRSQARRSSHFSGPDSATMILLNGRPKLRMATSARRSPMSLAVLQHESRLPEDQWQNTPLQSLWNWRCSQ